MMLTVSVNKRCAPQTVFPVDGPVVLGPGESLTAEFDEVQEAYIRACPGHYSIGPVDPRPIVGEDWQWTATDVVPPKAPTTPAPAPKPVQHRRRGRGRH